MMMMMIDDDDDDDDDELGRGLSGRTDYVLSCGSSGPT